MAVPWQATDLPEASRTCKATGRKGNSTATEVWVQGSARASSRKIHPQARRQGRCFFLPPRVSGPGSVRLAPPKEGSHQEQCGYARSNYVHTG